MKEFMTYQTKIERKRASKIICDFCNQEFTQNLDQAPVTTFYIEPGYGSRFDTEQMEFDICDNCLEKFTKYHSTCLKDIE